MKQLVHESASVLYEFAKASHKIEMIYNDLQLFKEGVGGEMPFTQMMVREGISYESKEKLLKDICQHFSEETQQFFDFFIAEKQLRSIYPAVLQFEKIYAQHHLTVTSAVALTSEQIDRIITHLSKKMSRSIDTYTAIVDQSVIAGVKAQGGDFVLDNTLQFQLETFRKTI